MRTRLHSPSKESRLLLAVGGAILRLSIVLATSALLSCASNSKQVSGNSQPCVPSQNRESCFYFKDSTKQNTKLIIFTHGVIGSAATTWGNPQEETFWPAMARKDSRFADYDIYLINYRSPFFGKAPNIHETANNELGQLSSRKIFEQYDEIYVIAHSMGGLVTKSILTQLNRGDDVPRLRRVKAVVFLSTPAQGANIARVAGFLSSTDQPTNMEPASLNAYISSLEDQWIRLIEDRDSAKAESPRAYCAHETLEMNYVLVVPKEMAASRCDGPLQSMPFNHSGMAKPTGPNADPYLWAMEKILDAGAYGVARHEASTLQQSAEQYVLAGKHATARQAYNDARLRYTRIEDRLGEANVFLGLGNLEFQLGRNDEARTAYTEARSLFRALGDRRGEARVLSGLGDLESQFSHNDETRAAYTEASSLFKAVGDRRGEARVLSGLGDLESQFSHNDEARTAYTKARSFFKAVGDRRGEAEALTGLGKLENRLTRNNEARTAFTEARSLFKAVGDRRGEAEALTGLGNLDYRLSHSNEARTAYTEARSLFKAVRSRRGEANVLCDLGNLEYRLGRSDEARSAYTGARSIFKALGNRLGEANALLGLGYLDSDPKTDRTNEAHSAFTAARTIYKDVGDRLGEANALRALGDLEYRLGHRNEAHNAYLDARSSYKDMESRLGEANALSRLGDIEQELGRNDEARNAYMEARGLYKDVGDLRGEGNTLLGLGRLLVTDNPDLARQFLYQAAFLFERVGPDKWKELALSEAKKLCP